MRIALVVSLYPPDISGAGVLVAGIARELSRRHGVAIFCGQNDSGKEAYAVDREIADGVPITRIEIHPFFSPFAKENYYNPAIDSPFDSFLQEFDPDIVHFHALQGLGATLVDVALKRRKKVVTTMHDWWWICPYLFLFKDGFRCSEPAKSCNCLDRTFLRDRNTYLQEMISRVQLVLVPSAFLEGSLETLGLVVPRMRINENGISAKRPAHWIRNTSERMRFAFFGGIKNIKGYEVLIEAVSMLRRYDFILKIYGVGLDTQQKRGISRFSEMLSNAFLILTNRGVNIFIQEVMKKIRSMQTKSIIGDKVRWLPPYGLAELPSIYSDLDAVLVPSVMMESFSLVTREAAVFGTPVITTPNGGAPLFIQDGFNGLVMETFTAGALAEKMRLLMDDREMFDNLRENMSRLSSAVRMLEEQVTELEGYYQSL
jgi:glycosyltransferase involved in cell wall biosynthesis